jgi:LmbE family N-acetylglucosaminyl deacetylase
MGSDLSVNTSDISERYMTQSHVSLIENAVLIVAHPDDEILWFGSVFDRVKRMIFCFMDCDSQPEWSAARRNALSGYPVGTVSWLDLKESESFDRGDWETPATSPFGMKILNSPRVLRQYELNYGNLKQKLSDELGGFSNVITHSPWGEYGNEEHVQVYRVVKDLQADLGFTLWFSNYVSSRSAKLFLDYLPQLPETWVHLPVSREMAERLKGHYEANACWTWFQDWAWPEKEAFFMDCHRDETQNHNGRLFPLNMIHFWTRRAVHNHGKGSVARRIGRFLVGAPKEK